MARALIAADTDLVIDWLRDRGAGLDAVDRWVSDDRLRFTAVTAFELRQGADYVERESQLLSLLRDRVLALDFGSALRAGSVFRALRERGEGIGLKDSLQAGVCLQYGVPLATRNVRHFERVEGLELTLLGE